MSDADTPKGAPTLKQTMEMLDKLAEERDRQEALRISLAQQQEAAMPAEVRAALTEIAALYDPQLAANVVAMADLQQAIEKAVLPQGETVKGTRLMAVYSKGRVKWKTQALDGYLKAHPELAEFREQGAPSVAIRKVAEGE